MNIAGAIAVSRVAVGLPSRMESVTEILARNGRPATEQRMFDRLYKLRQSPTLGDDELMADLLIRTGLDALAGRRAALVLYGHTLQVQPFAHDGAFADRVRAELGLPGAPFFGVSHVACTSVLRSIEPAGRFLGRDGHVEDECVLVLGGDQGSVWDRARIVPGMTVSGDAAIGLRVERTGRYRVLSTATRRDTRFHRNLKMSADELALFGAVCADQQIAAIDAGLAEAGLTRADVDWVMPHLSNAMFWKTVSAKSGIGVEKFRTELLPQRGHNFGTDALMALEHADALGELAAGQRCVLLSLGQGAYYQVVVIEIAEES